MRQLILGDCRDIMPSLGKVDLIIADPDYGNTPALKWSKQSEGWVRLAALTLKASATFWCFGTLKFFMINYKEFDKAGLEYIQDLVWRKQSGTNWNADRFRKVHEHIVQFKLKSSKWGNIYKCPVVTLDAKAKTVVRYSGSKHLNKIGKGHIYRSIEGGPRLQRSVIDVRNCNGYAVHPTQKPVDILRPLIEYSCPKGGVVADWFAGSASIGVVASELGRNYIGCEINPEFYMIGLKRLNEA